MVEGRGSITVMVGEAKRKRRRQTDKGRRLSTSNNKSLNPKRKKKKTYQGNIFNFKQVKANCTYLILMPSKNYCDLHEK